MSHFVMQGVSFNWACEPDYHMTEPWKEQDGHGVVRQVRRPSPPNKKPGEVIIYNEGGYFWIYDVSETIRLAAAGGWGLGDEHRGALAKRLGRSPTQKEITAEVVRHDTVFCRKYLSGDVGWFTVSCWPEEDPDAIEYLGGCLGEYGSPYFESVAQELAEDYLVLKEANQKELLAKQAANEVELDLHMAGL